MNYREYILSSQWRAFRFYVLEQRGECCEFCGARREAAYDDTVFHLHHLDYSRLGHEHPEDVIVLCRSCHDDVHEFPKRKAEVAAFAARRVLPQFEAERLVERYYA